MGKAARTVFIGDVHGCLDELQQLIGLLQIKGNDRVILLGDLINRGPYPVEVVEYVARKGYECILGNHEDYYLRNYKHDAKYAKLHKKLGPELREWIKRRPLYIEDKNFLAVHAGLQPNTKLSDTPRRLLLNIRTWDGEGKDLNNPNCPAWYEYYKETRPVFYGHWASQGLCLRKNTLGLDSGCVYGRTLSAYILEEESLLQVAAAQTYCRD